MRHRLARGQYLEAAATALRHEGVSLCEAPYWTAYWLNFATLEQIRCAQYEHNRDPTTARLLTAPMTPYPALYRVSECDGREGVAPRDPWAFGRIQRTASRDRDSPVRDPPAAAATNDSLTLHGPRVGQGLIITQGRERSTASSGAAVDPPSDRARLAAQAVFTTVWRASSRKGEKNCGIPRGLRP